MIPSLIMHLYDYQFSVNNITMRWFVATLNGLNAICYATDHGFETNSIQRALFCVIEVQLFSRLTGRPMNDA